MSEKEYVVTLNKGVDYAQFNQEMIASTGAGDIPNRTVDVADARALSTRNTHYALTDAEAESLRNDNRVTDVQLRPQDRDDIEIGYDAVQTANFNKSTSDSGDYRDWGKITHSFKENKYGTSTSLGGDFSRPYSMDGTGVDVVIQDSGLQVDHPEFFDANGNSRMQLIDWYAASGVTGSQSTNHYRDYDGHGTHCGGTATGLNFGWASNARVYSVKVSGLEGSGDSGGISISNCFDVIKGWHQNKPVDPKTGYKRPTIVNASWGYSGSIGSSFSNISSYVYRGANYNSSTAGWSSSTTYHRDTYGFYPYYRSFSYRYPVRIASVDADVEDCVDAGVHICIAAGNNSFKIADSTDPDYDNVIFWTSGNNYYHRGSSPFDTGAIIVGATDMTPQNATTERKTSFSCTGPGVDIFSAGENIISACSTTTRFGNTQYFGDSSFKQTNISGTSMASPQVCGVGAIYLQADPSLTPAQLKSKLQNDALAVLKDESNDANYGDTTDICGGYNRMLYNRYSREIPFKSNIYGLQKKNR
jgi:subtilisin family serine protease